MNLSPSASIVMAPFSASWAVPIFIVGAGPAHSRRDRPEAIDAPVRTASASGFQRMPRPSTAAARTLERKWLAGSALARPRSGGPRLLPAFFEHHDFDTFHIVEKADDGVITARESPRHRPLQVHLSE